MIVCPLCGFRNLDANPLCFRCRGLLQRDEGLLQEATTRADRKSRGHRWGSFLTAPYDRFRHYTWVSRIFSIPDQGPYRYPYTAGLLSLVPGVGHWYAGQPWKGLLLFLAGCTFAGFAAVSFRQSWNNYVLLALLIFWLIVWADSVAVAVRANGDRWSLRNTLALWFAAMMLVGFTVSATQILGSNFATLQMVTSNAMEPHIKAGDRVLFSSVPLWLRHPRPGETVTFDPPRFSAEQGLDSYSINITKYFQRVLGGPGDTVAKRAGVFYRNGVSVALEQQPYNGAVLPDFELIVPPKTYFIPVTNIPADILAGLTGSGSISYVGQPGFGFPGWPKQCLVQEADISAVGLVVADPPPRRRWIN